MASVTAFTAERSLEIEKQGIKEAHIVGMDLILTRNDGTTINVGRVKGDQGPVGTTGGIPDAPLDGKIYVRKSTGGIGGWALSEVGSTAGMDTSKTYGAKNGELVVAGRPWKLEFDNTTPGGSIPSGWATGALAPFESWTAKFSGTGYVTTFSLAFSIKGSMLTGTSRMTLPTDLRPIVDVATLGFLSDDRSGYVGTGTTGVLISKSGLVTAPRFQDGVITRVEPSPVTISRYSSSFTVNVKVDGVFVRSSETLPNKAVWA